MAMIIDPDAPRAIQRRKAPHPRVSVMAAELPDTNDLDSVDLDLAPEVADRRRYRRRRGLDRRRRYPLPPHLGNHVDRYA